MSEDKLPNIPLEEIDMDMIKRLRREGDWEGAEALLEAFRHNCSKQWKQESKELKKQERQIKKAKGICVEAYCEEKTHNNFSYCKKHRDAHCKYGIIRYNRKRNHICNFEECKKERKHKSIYCEFHHKVKNYTIYANSELTEKELEERRKLQRERYVKWRDR